MGGNLKTLVIASLAGLLSAGVVALATQTNYLGTVFIADTTTPSNQLKVNSDGSLNVNGSFSATLAPFAPGAAYATVTSNATSHDAALPTGLVVALFNTGTSAVSCELSVGAGTALASENIIQPGSWFGVAVGSNTHYACINQAGDSASNVVVASGGTGLPAGSGGGSSGGGSSGAVFGPTAVGSAAANPPVLTGGTSDGTGTGNVGVWKIVSGIGYLNIAQVNGVTTLAGAGAVGTGSQRVAVGQDTTTIAGSAPGTAGTPSSQVISVQGVSGGTAQPVSAASSSYASGAFAAGSGTDGWNVTEGTKADAAWSSGSGSIVSILKTISGNTGAAVPDCGANPCTNHIGVTDYRSQYPAGAVPITASATGTTAATTATLAATTGKTTYICSSSVRANATAATTVTDTITGVITATMSSVLWVAPLASGLGVDEQIFSPCVPASGTNTSIAVVSGAPGSGGTVSVHATGYQL